MAKKDKISASEIITFYMDYVVEHQIKPDSVEDFAQLHQFDAVVFYEFLPPLKNLEKTIYNNAFSKFIW